MKPTSTKRTYIDIELNKTTQNNEDIQQYFEVIAYENMVNEFGEPDPTYIESLIFEIDKSSLDDKSIKDLKDTIQLYIEMQFKSNCFLPICSKIAIKDDDLLVTCMKPYNETITKHHNGETTEKEIMMHIADLVEIYLFLTKMKLDVTLSVDNVSLVLYRDEKNPIARMCLTPY